MTVTIEQLLFDYMTVVRANGKWAINNVATNDPDDPSEIIWEVIEAHENIHGPVDSDPMWPLARVAAQMAITICQQHTNHINTNPERDDK